MGVEVHPPVAVLGRAGEPHQGHPELLGGVHGERARSGDAGQQRDPRHAGLLGDLEARPGGDQQEAVAQRQPVLEQGPADHLVDRVVPTHVLAHHKQVPLAVHERGRMHPAGAGEDGLAAGELARGAEDRAGGDRPIPAEGVAAASAHRVDTLAAAHPAGRTGGEVLRDHRQQLRPRGREVHDVVGVLREAGAVVDHRAVAVAGLADVLAVGDQPLAVEESVDQLDVVAGRAHRQRQLLTVQPDVQRLLDGDVVALPPRVQPTLAHTDGADAGAVGDPAHPPRIDRSPAAAVGRGGGVEGRGGDTGLGHSSSAGPAPSSARAPPSARPRATSSCSSQPRRFSS